MGGIIHGMGLLLRFCETRSVNALDVAVRNFPRPVSSANETVRQRALRLALESLGGDRHCASTGMSRYCRTAARNRTQSCAVVLPHLITINSPPAYAWNWRGVHTLVLPNPCPSCSRYLCDFDIITLPRCRPQSAHLWRSASPPRTCCSMRPPTPCWCVVFATFHALLAPYRCAAPGLL
ncbi:hypothetical protein DFH06DRAFT_644738 [Mycena polygramma]|nr:hypothetical protein DFH06DRAFT_644738 [Mycena polygramma]